MPPDHLRELQHRLAVLLKNIEIGGGSDYEDIGYNAANQIMFEAHYSGIVLLLDEWNAVVWRVTHPDAAEDLESAKAELRELQPVFQGEILRRQKVSEIRVQQSCPVCRDNESWPEPKPSLMRRMRSQIKASK